MMHLVVDGRRFRAPGAVSRPPERPLCFEMTESYPVALGFVKDFPPSRAA